MSSVFRNLSFITALRLRDRALGIGRDPGELDLLGGLFLVVGEPSETSSRLRACD